MEEIWKIVPSFEEYEASNLGNIRRRQTRYGKACKRSLRPSLATNGYLTVSLSAFPIRKCRTVHSIIAETFIGPRPCGLDVCHNNSDRLDNRAENLRYATRKSNMHDSVIAGTMHRGERTGISRFTAEQIMDIRFMKANGERACDIARKYNMHPIHLYQIINGATWKHLPVLKNLSAGS